MVKEVNASHISVRAQSIENSAPADVQIRPDDSFLNVDFEYSLPSVTEVLTGAVSAAVESVSNLFSSTLEVPVEIDEEFFDAEEEIVRDNKEDIEEQFLGAVSSREDLVDIAIIEENVRENKPASLTETFWKGVNWVVSSVKESAPWGWAAAKVNGIVVEHMTSRLETNIHEKFEPFVRTRFSNTLALLNEKKDTFEWLRDKFTGVAAREAQMKDNFNTILEDRNFLHMSHHLLTKMGVLSDAIRQAKGDIIDDKELGMIREAREAKRKKLDELIEGKITEEEEEIIEKLKEEVEALSKMIRKDEKYQEYQMHILQNLGIRASSVAAYKENIVKEIIENLTKFSESKDPAWYEKVINIFVNWLMSFLSRFSFFQEKLESSTKKVENIAKSIAKELTLNNDAGFKTVIEAQLDVGTLFLLKEMTSEMVAIAKGDAEIVGDILLQPKWQHFVDMHHSLLVEHNFQRLTDKAGSWDGWARALVGISKDGEENLIRDIGIKRAFLALRDEISSF